MDELLTTSRLKFLVLTDSVANPRSFPIESSVTLEDTYPYIIRDLYPNAIFWQLSYGNLTSQDLIDQTIGYLNHWDPDFIVIQSGINDCRPEAFTEFQKTCINKFSGPFFRYLKKHLYNPKLIAKRRLQRVSERSFRKNLLKLKMIFNESRILWLEISTNPNYERARPGVISRMGAFNRIIEEAYGEGMVRLQEKLLEISGFNPDNLHLNKQGHRLVAEMLQRKINHYLENRQECE
jgi:lysophospholipase L1-like esterase